MICGIGESGQQQNILKLLNDEELYDKKAKEALELARNKWNWKIRVKNITDDMLKGLYNE